MMTTKSLFNSSKKFLLCASLLFSTVDASCCEGAEVENEGILTCSFVAILANPQAIEGRIVNTEGFLTTKDNETLWLSKEDFRQKRRLNAVRLCFTGETKVLINGRASKSSIPHCHGQSVTIVGRYTRKDVSLLDPFPTGKITVENVVIFSPSR